MTITSEDLEIFRDNFKFIGEELARLEKEMKSGVGAADIRRERELTARERNLIASEREASKNESLALADQQNNARDAYRAERESLEARLAEANDALDQRAKSTKAGLVLHQSQMADLQAAMADASVEINDAQLKVKEILQNIDRVIQRQDEVTKRQDKQLNRDLENFRSVAAELNNAQIKDRVAAELRLLVQAGAIEIKDESLLGSPPKEEAK